MRTLALLMVALLVAAPALAVSETVALAPFVLKVTGTPAASIPTRDAGLLELVHRADARFGIERPPAAYEPLAQLSPALTQVVADLLHALLWAADERDAAYEGISGAQIDAALGVGDASDLLARIDGQRVRSAATALARAVDASRPVLTALSASLPTPPRSGALAPPLIDIFPVLGIDPIGVANVFPHDYFLSIDMGGDDVYDNNAGGSIIQRGASVGDPDTWGPTVVVPDTPVVQVGDVFFDAGGDIIVGGEFEEGEAVHTATLAIDVAGDDVYGVYKQPSAMGIDRQCTSDPVIRRVVIQGSAGGGIGILADLAGNDQYRAKTLAQGSGHVAGVGVLFDAEGDDTFTAVRSALGVGLLGGVGVFVDPSGNDRYVLAAPTGGIYNQPDERCDASLRIALGVGAITGAGFFFDGAGNDLYRAQSQALGHADPQSIGIFIDAQGTDDYGGYVARGDARTFTTTPAGGLGMFRDLS